MKNDVKMSYFETLRGLSASILLSTTTVDKKIKIAQANSFMIESVEVMNGREWTERNSIDVRNKSEIFALMNARTERAWEVWTVFCVIIALKIKKIKFSVEIYSNS